MASLSRPKLIQCILDFGGSLEPGTTTNDAVVIQRTHEVVGLGVEGGIPTGDALAELCEEFEPIPASILGPTSIRLVPSPPAIKPT